MSHLLTRILPKGRVAFCAALSLAGATLAPAPVAAQTSPPVPFAATPDSNVFYKQPDSFAGKSLGDILDYMPITPKLAVVAPNFTADGAWRIKFVSKDFSGKLIAAVATIIKPGKQWQWKLVSGPFGFPVLKWVKDSYSGPSKLVAYQYAEDSLGADCAPSHQVAGDVNLSNPVGSFNFSSQLEPLQYSVGLTQGWTVVVTDHEGPDHTYGEGRTAGQITLDAMRASLKFSAAHPDMDLRLNASTPIGMWGYSGGSIGTAWAAQIKANYAPELNIVGVAAGGVAAADLGSAIRAFNGDIHNTPYNVMSNFLFSLGYAAVIGVNRAYPEMVTPILNEKGVRVANAIKDGCGGLGTHFTNLETILDQFPMGRFEDFTTVDDPFTYPGVINTLPKINLPQANEIAPRLDIFLYHAQGDQLIPVMGVDNLYDKWCAAGTPIHYWRGSPAIEHISMVALGAMPAIDYLNTRFAGNRYNLTNTNLMNYAGNNYLQNLVTNLFSGNILGIGSTNTIGISNLLGGGESKSCNIGSYGS